MQPYQISILIITTVLCLQGNAISPFEQVPAARKPVTASGCRCGVCNSEDSAFQHEDRENAAFVKPAIQSSVYIEGGQTSSDACAAVSGITGPEYKARQSASPSCVRTHPADLSPWFSVDLLYVFSFQELTLFREQSSAESQIMASLDVLVDGRLCYSYPSDITEKGMSIPLESKVTCEQTMTGRYIRLQKRRPEMMGVKPESSQHKFLSLCQLQLWVCKMGTYGASGQSCENCSTICQYACNNYYGCDNRTLHDVGINKAVEVSSLQWGDGSYINDMFQTPHDSSHCVKTRDTGRPTLHWVRIDLGTTYMVYNLEVQARVDCCSEHELRKFYVSVADEKLQTMLFPPKTDHVCLYNVDAVPIRYTANLTCDIPKAGRFVALIKNDAIGLSLCEVRIFGHPYITLELTEECTPEYREAVCGPGLLCERGRCRGKVKHHCLKQEDCVSTTACDSGWCKNKLHIKCTATDECQGGMVCDKVFGECRYDHESTRHCSSSSDCESESLCDRQFLCRVAVGGRCGNRFDCSDGGQCSRGKCICDSSVSASSSNGQCVPRRGKPGAKCKSDKDCFYMPCINSTCTCPKGQITNTILRCVGEPWQACRGDHTCASGLQCIYDRCRLPGGVDCRRHSSACFDGRCDGGICRMYPGKRCMDNSSCVSGSFCRTGGGGIAEGYCYTYSGGSCRSYGGKNLCRDGNCVDKKCRVPARQNCTKVQGLPPPFCEGVCDENKVCRQRLKQPCLQNDQCLSGLVCTGRPYDIDKSRRCRKPIDDRCIFHHDCENTLNCDHLKRCRIPNRLECKGRTDMCMSGAKCNGRVCFCVSGLTAPSDDLCKGRKGVVTGDCKDERPKCEDTFADCVGGTCQCGASFVPVPEDLTCRVKQGFACSQNYSIPCSRGAVCDRGVCVLQTGQRCRGIRKGRCQTVGVCDVDDHCRVNINQSCADQPTSCRNGSVCDLQQDLCKVKPGEQCTSFRDCVAGSTCDQRYTCQCAVGISFLNETSHTCVPEAGRVGGVCINSSVKSSGNSSVNSSDTDSLTCNATFTECNNSTNRCQCQPEFIVDLVDFSCKKKPGGPCTDDAECVHGSICIAGKCSVPLGGHCEKNGVCVSDTVCDSDGLCKIDLNGNCSGSRQDFCKMGTACDWMHHCRLPVGDRCSLTLTAEGNVHSCVAGANCQDSVCTCDPEVSSDYGAVCKPSPGRFGSSCGNGTDGECTMPGTVCVNNMCVCEGGHSPDEEFGCGGSEDDENETESDASSGSKGVIAGIVAGGVVVAAAVALLVYRKLSSRRRKQPSQREEAETERSRDEGDVRTSDPGPEATTEVTETSESNVDLDVSESEVDSQTT